MDRHRAIYGLYHSETVVGEALKHIDRDKVVLSTKCGLEWRHETPVLHKVVDGTAVYRDLSAQSIIEDVEDSLRRLGTDTWMCCTPTGRARTSASIRWRRPWRP